MHFSSENSEFYSSVVFEIDPVFVYQIGDKLKSSHKASEWDISNPVWRGKLQIVEFPSNRRQVLFVNTDGIFGAVANNKEPVESPTFQKVLDSSRYFTTQIEYTISGEIELVGIGFMDGNDGSRLLESLQQYFNPKKQVNTVLPMKRTEKDPTNAVPEISKVSLNPLQESQSDKSIDLQYYRRARPVPAEDLLNEKLVRTGKSPEQKLDGKTGLNFPEPEPGPELGRSTTNTRSLLVRQTSAEQSTAVVEKKGEEGIPYFFKTRRKNSRFSCHLCPSKEFFFSKMKHLLIHWKTKHGLNEIHNCRLCHLIFSTREQRLRHGKNAHHFTCSTCALEFLKETSLSNHIYYVHERGQQGESFERSSNDHDHEAEGNSTYDRKRKYEKTLQLKITIDNRTKAKGEKHRGFSKKRKIEAYLEQDRNKVDINSMDMDAPIAAAQSAQEEDHIGSFLADRKLRSGHSDVLGVTTGTGAGGGSGAGAGTRCLDPVTSQLICPFCTFSTNTYSKYSMNVLVSHWRTDHDDMENPISTCRLCYTIFSNPEKRLSHINSHHLVCSICAFEFELQKNLLHHLKNAHLKRGFCMEPGNALHYACNRCSEEFENIHDLMDHFRPSDLRRMLHDPKLIND